MRVTDPKILLFVAAFLWPVVVYGGDEAPGGLYELSIDELLEIKVTSVSKKPESLSETAAAVYVITAEDIRRSGFTTIAEVLRMVPGLEVGRIDASKWAVTSRGFGGRLASKLLVLIDGRTVYTPIFSGVFWNRQDVFLEDIARIEVIRGPGATLWGANAVNGVINVITKGAEETCFTSVSIGGGTEERVFGSLRYGAQAGASMWYRVYGKYLDRDDLVYPSGERAADGWDDARCGFRMDSDLAGGDHLTIQGDIHDSDLGETYAEVGCCSPPYVQVVNKPADVSGGNMLGRWSHLFAGSSEMVIQMYFDRAAQSSGFVAQADNTFDVDYEHHMGIGHKQDLVWGLGYRYIDSRTEARQNARFEPANRRLNLLSAFVQDEVELVTDRLRLTVGSKFERNDYTGFEIQPNVRLLWMPGDRQTLWGAVSRAVRTPSRAEWDVRVAMDVIPPGVIFPDTLPVLTEIQGSEDFTSEELIAYEFGYRVRPLRAASFDLAVFRNQYDNLLTIEQGTPYFDPSPTPHYVLPLPEANKMSGYAYGGELAADCQLAGWWRLRASYSYLEVELTLDEGSTDIISKNAAEGSPQHQVRLHSRMDLPRAFELDLGFRYVDEMPSVDIDSYSALDARLGWSCLNALRISIVGQNLLQRKHGEAEAVSLDCVLTEVERGAYVMIDWRR